MKRRRFKRLTLSIVLAITAGVFLFPQTGYAAMTKVGEWDPPSGWIVMSDMFVSDGYGYLTVRYGTGDYRIWKINTGVIYTISGTVKDINNEGVGGVAIYLNGDIVSTTGGDGSYTRNVANGTYSVKATNKTYPFVSKNITINGSDETCNFYAIGGSASYNGAGVGSADIYVNDQLWTSTAANGSYEVEYLPPAAYTVKAIKSGYTFDPFPLTITNISRDDIHFYTYDIFGYIRRHDLGGVSGPEAGINGINVRITGGNADINETLVTHDRYPDNPPESRDPGYYELKRIGGGTYTIEAQNP